MKRPSWKWELGIFENGRKENRLGDRSQEFNIGRVKFEMPVRNPTIDVE